MLGHYPNPSPDHEAQLGLVVANLFREEGWKVVKQPRERGAAPDLIASRPGKKLVVEIKRASEGRKDRVIPLLSQAALEASYYSRSLSDHPLPVAIVGANHMPERSQAMGSNHLTLQDDRKSRFVRPNCVRERHSSFRI